MGNIRVTYEPDGRCSKVDLLPEGHGLSSNEGTFTSDNLSTDNYHKEPYLSDFRAKKIKNKAKELLSMHGYVFGLSTGWQKDEEYKNWIQDVINLSNSFENQTIEETQINFPIDPWGKQEVLNL